MMTDFTVASVHTNLPLEASGEWTALLREECCIGRNVRQELQHASSSDASLSCQLTAMGRAIASLFLLTAVACFSGLTNFSPSLDQASTNDDSDRSVHQD